MFKKIVVGIDGSNASEQALVMACDIAQKYQSEIHLVHTPQPKTVAFALGAATGYHAVTTMPSPGEVDAACEKILQSGIVIAKENGQEIAKTYGERGEPADQLVACAAQCDADLIVTGRRGLGGLGNLVQGSTSSRVSHLAQCACLTVV